MQRRKDVSTISAHLPKDVSTISAHLNTEMQPFKAEHKHHGVAKN